MIVTVDWSKKKIDYDKTSINGTIKNDKDFEINYIFGTSTTAYFCDTTLHQTNLLLKINYSKSGIICAIRTPLLHKHPFHPQTLSSSEFYNKKSPNSNLVYALATCFLPDCIML